MRQRICKKKYQKKKKIKGYEILRSLTQDYLNHTEKPNLQELQEYLEERLQRRLTAEKIQFVDNVLKESLYQESNVISSPNEVVVDSEMDRSGVRSPGLDSINTPEDVTFEKEGKDSKSIAIEPAIMNIEPDNDEIEREEKEEKAIYEITLPVDVDKLGLQLSINGGITINKIYPSSFLYEPKHACHVFGSP